MDILVKVEGRSKLIVDGATKVLIRPMKYSLARTGRNGTKIFIFDSVLKSFIFDVNKDRRLDPALVRPGRVDLKEFVGYCDQEQIELMFLRFYKGDKAGEHAKTFARKVLEQKKVVSPAQIQGYFMFHKHSPPEEVLLDVETIWTL